MKLYQNIGNCYDEMIYRRQSITFLFKKTPLLKVEIFLHHEALLKLKFLQMKPQVIKLTKIQFDL